MSKKSTVLSQLGAQANLDSLPSSTYDLAIVGGGIVGLTLACALKGSGLKVALIESQPKSAALLNRRAYAVTLMSGQIFEGLGLWQNILPKITTFKTIRLADATCQAIVNLKPNDLGTRQLGYVAEHRVIAEALYQSLENSADITFFCPFTVRSVNYAPNGVKVFLADGEQQINLDAQLLVAADGSRSPIRQHAQIETMGWPYWQSCVTAVIQPEHSHADIAREHFWPSGPFATLPLTDNRCQIVLTAPHEEAKELIAMDESDFLAELDKRYGHELGRLKLLSDRILFPVKLMQSQSYIRPRLALIGDAAHSCHPVGGQGLNLGIRDAAALAQVVLATHGEGRDIGSIQALKRYAHWRKFENWIILGFTDLLNRSFSNQNPVIVALRRLGLRLMARFGMLKYLSLSLMTGMGGRWPAIASKQNRDSSRIPVLRS